MLGLRTWYYVLEDRSINGLSRTWILDYNSYARGLMPFQILMKRQ